MHAKSSRKTFLTSINHPPLLPPTKARFDTHPPVMPENPTLILNAIITGQQSVLTVPGALLNVLCGQFYLIIVTYMLKMCTRNIWCFIHIMSLFFFFLKFSSPLPHHLCLLFFSGQFNVGLYSTTFTWTFLQWSALRKLEPLCIPISSSWELFSSKGNCQSMCVALKTIKGQCP